MPCARRQLEDARFENGRCLAGWAEEAGTGGAVRALSGLPPPEAPMRPLAPSPPRPLALSLLVLTSLGAGCTGGVRPGTETPPPADTTDTPDLGPPAGAGPAVGPFEDEADYRQQRAETAAALEAAIEPATTSSVAACRVVPTSEQACGGPTTFAVYSAEDPDAAEVERLAERLVALDRQANRQFEYVSTCMAYRPPEPALRDGRCVADR